MSGINRNNGTRVSGWEHTQLCVHDLITTPIGTRVGRRDYGCDLPSLIDRPGTASWIGRATSAIVISLNKWEPRFSLTSAKVIAAGADGHYSLQLTGTYYPRGHLGDKSVAESNKSFIIKLAA